MQDSARLGIAGAMPQTESEVYHRVAARTQDVIFTRSLVSFRAHTSSTVAGVCVVERRPHLEYLRGLCTFAFSLLPQSLAFSSRQVVRYARICLNWPGGRAGGECVGGLQLGAQD